MVRRCCVLNCVESDLTILAHRFPKGEHMALQWQNALNLKSIPLEHLKQNYVVCTKHFSSKAYRNAISNSLNTTAIPSIHVYDDNERVDTTRTRDKGTNIPKRCHKSPSLVNKSQKAISTVHDDILQPIKKQKIDLDYFEYENQEEEVNEQQDTILGLSETCEDVPLEIISLNDVNEQISIITDQVTQTEVDQSDKEIQTDKVEQSTTNDFSSQESKDDKLVKLLYPEYGEKSKMELIKMIIERNQKIKLLEEEKQIMEDAMTKLL